MTTVYTTLFLLQLVAVAVAVEGNVRHVRPLLSFLRKKNATHVSTEKSTTNEDASNKILLLLLLTLRLRLIPWLPNSYPAGETQTTMICIQ